MAATSIPQPETPTSALRLQVVDTLRGIALLGMLLVHFGYYVSEQGARAKWFSDFIGHFAEERFYPLFALLFGVGFALQFRRTAEPDRFVRMYLRRMAALMAIAVVLIATTGYHVLESYAFWGTFLLAIRRWSDRAILTIFLFCAIAQPVRNLAIYEWDKGHLTVEQSNRKLAEDRRVWPDYRAEEERLRTEGSFSELAGYRVAFNLAEFFDERMYFYGYPLGMILLGTLAVRRKIFDEPARHRALLVAITIYGIAAGALTFATFDLSGGSPYLRWGAFKQSLFYALANDQFQGLAYASLVVLWIARHGVRAGVLSWLSILGRMSLTNYIVQIAILETFFGSNTLHLPLTVINAAAGVMVVGALQIAFSRFWMKRFRYGPLEWLWRCATYANWVPIRR